MRLYSVPAVTHLERQNMTVHLTDSNRFESDYPVEIKDSIARPKEDTNGDTPYGDSESARLTELLKAMFARIQDIIEAALEDEIGKITLRLSWERVAKRMLDDRGDTAEPFMDLIVKHANELHRTVTSTAEHPRRILKRVRLLMSVSRIQEMDPACLTDYVRRPGITPAEKAGPRQVLMGIDREETYDTVENRVLKDFLKRSSLTARIYLRAFSRYRTSGRWRRVQHYETACRRLWRDPVIQTVKPLTHRPTPNYVLLFNPAYHKIWLAYQELLRHEDREDDAWRWQHRLWADIGRIIVHSALFCTSPSEDGRPGMSPLFFRQEQSRGRWTEEIPQSALFLLNGGKSRVVAAPIDIRTAQPHPKTNDWQRSLGPTMLIHLEECGAGRQASILVWTLHSTGLTQPPLTDAVESAHESLKSCIADVKRYMAEDQSAQGLILQSNRNLTETPESVTVGAVSGVAFAPSNANISQTLRIVGHFLKRSVMELFA
ncbi:MAG: DUF2357 domain-containing protein [Deltaproteobacteria bacterium]